MTELLPCPFCGGEGHLEYSETEESRGSMPLYWVECLECHSNIDCFNASEPAVKAWNTRKEAGK